MNRTILITALLVAASTANAGVYKCTAPDGSLTFSDKPCPDAPGKEVHLRDKDHVPDPVTQRMLRSQGRLADEFDRRREQSNRANLRRRSGTVAEKQANDAEERRLRHAKNRRQVVDGMGEDDVRDVLGKPDRVNQSSGSDQWVYDDGDQSTYVYVEDGEVDSWSRYGVKPD